MTLTAVKKLQSRQRNLYTYHFPSHRSAITKYSALFLCLLVFLLSSMQVVIADSHTDDTSEAVESSDEVASTPPSEPAKKPIGKIECGNGVCELSENRHNCPNDCSILPFEYNLDFSNIKMSPGQNRVQLLTLKSTRNKSMDLIIDVFGDIEPYVKLNQSQFALGPFGVAEVGLEIKIPKDMPNQVLEGDIVITAGTEETVLPTAIRVVQISDNPFVIELSVLTSEVQSHELLKWYYRILAKTNEHKNLKINYSIISEENQSTIHSWLEEIEFDVEYVSDNELALNITEELNLSELLPARYFLEARFNYEEEEYVTTSSFQVIAPFWTPSRLKILMIVVGIVAVGSIGYFGYKKYRAWKLSKMRYLFPDYEKLPAQDDYNFYLGYVAETKKKAFYNPDDLNTHMLVAGSTGSGKSVTASIFVEEALIHKIPVCIFDPTNQWTGFVQPCRDENLLKHYKKFGMKRDDARPFKGLIYNVTTADIDIDFSKYMNPGEVTVFALAAMKIGEYDIAVKRIIDTIFQVQWNESPQCRLICVFDEVHRLLDKYGGQGGYLALEKACREFRKWGIGVVMASQVSADFKEAVGGNVLTEVQLNTKSMEDINKIQQKYGEEYASRVTRQGIGVAMIQNPKYNDGKPWFVQIKPTLHSPHKVPEEEFKLYTTYADQLKEQEDIVDQAAKEIDVTDIALELKLAKDKLKEGHFKMAEIYINSLKQSVSKLDKYEHYVQAAKDDLERKRKEFQERLKKQKEKEKEFNKNLEKAQAKDKKDKKPES